MKTPPLFNVEPTRKTRRVLLSEFKAKHGIETYRSQMRREDHPWIALLRFDCDTGKSIGQVMAESCRLYDESGYLATGEGELSAVRKLCQQRGITCSV